MSPTSDFDIPIPNYKTTYVGKDGSRLADISNKDFNAQILKFCRNEILGKDVSPRKSGEADLLKSYSPW